MKGLKDSSSPLVSKNVVPPNAGLRTQVASPIAQRGIGLPIAIFVITVLSAFAVNMGLLVQDNASGRSEYITSLRASLAADTGADLGMNVAFDPSDAPDYASGVTCSSTAINYSFTNDTGMSGCSAAVTCTSATAGGKTIHTITSVGTCDSISKTVEISAL
jgi:MSHA biogenesis protein MshP